MLSQIAQVKYITLKEGNKIKTRAQETRRKNYNKENANDDMILFDKL